MDGENVRSTFDTAAEKAGAEAGAEPPAGGTVAELGGGAAGDAAPAAEPTPRRRGRGRSGSGRTRSRSRAPADGVAVPRAPDKPKVPAISPGTIAPTLRQLDKTFVRALGTRPLDEQELTDGAAALAPVLDHYVPLFTDAVWMPALVWAAMVYAPRAAEVYEQRKESGRKPARFPAGLETAPAAESAAVAAPESAAP